MATPKNGAKRTTQFVIISFCLELIKPTNEDGTPKLGRNGKPQLWYIIKTQGKGDVWVTAQAAKQLAKNAGFPTVESCSSAITNAFDTCYLVLAEKYCAVGQPITDDAGEPKLDDVGNSIGTYKGSEDNPQDYWQEVNREHSLAMSEDAIAYITEINKALDMEDVRNQRKADNDIIKRVKGMQGITTVVTKKEKEEDEDEDANEDANENIIAPTPPAPLTEQQKKENAAAKKAGKPLPHPVN